MKLLYILLLSITIALPSLSFAEGCGSLGGCSAEKCDCEKDCKDCKEDSCECEECECETCKDK